MMGHRLTHNQITALIDLNDGEWRYGIEIRGRRSLPSLVKRGLVSQQYGDRSPMRSADRWQITDAGRVAVNGQATIQHLRPQRTPLATV